MERKKTTVPIIDKLGGTSKTVHELMSIGYLCDMQTVSNWRRRGIPTKAVVALLRVCENKNMSVAPSDFEVKKVE